MRSLLITMLTLTAVLVTACGGGTGSPAEAPTDGATAPASLAPATVTNASPVAATGDDERSRAAAIEIFHGVIDPACTMDHPAKDGYACIFPRSSAETIAGGIAVFEMSYEAGGSYLGVLGRTPGGEWQFWHGPQQSYPLFALPGEMRVCADGEGLNLRSESAATAPQVTLLADGTVVRGDKFVLTEPGTVGGYGAPRGHGWFHLTAPQEGWAYSKYLSHAASGDCAERDIVESGAR